MKESLEDNHLVLSCTLSNGTDTINVYFMIDCYASRKAFIDSSFVQFHKIHLHPLCQTRTVTVVDGRVTSSGVINHFVRFPLVINNHIETTDMFVTKLGHYPVILGIPWLRLHNLHNHWKANTLTFNSMHCLSHCLIASKSTTVHGLSVIPNHYRLMLVFLPGYRCLFL